MGRYALYGAIAAGGMATVHLGRLLGPVGFSRTVAIKRLHAQFASDPEFVSMFLDEARLAARIRHPNVVQTVDVVATGGELFLVMDYVPGESIARLSRVLRERDETIPLRILSATITGVLHGLHAAHEAKDEQGHPLGIVHRDVSPQNVLMGTDGVPRVLDFGVAKAAGRMQTTKEGQIKGKLSYMPPEQLRGAAVTRQTDIYAVGVMLWELVTGERLFSGENEGFIVTKILEGRIEPPSQVVIRSRRIPRTDPTVRALEALDATILRALSMGPDMRFATAREMALEIERKCPPATSSECGDWVENVACDVLSSRAAMVADIESSPSVVSNSRENHVQSVLNATQTLAPPRLESLASNGLPYALSTTTGPVISSYSAPLPPVTQPSSISVSTALLGRRSDGGSSRRKTVAALFGLLLGAGFMGSALIYRHITRPIPPQVGVVAATSAAAKTINPASSLVPTGLPAPTPSPTPLTPLVVTTPPFEVDVMDAGSQAKPGGSSIATKHPPAVVAKPPPAVRPTTKSTSTTPPNSGGADCSIPYWFDEGGVKHYKPQCLGR